jgi:hypothetical protein
MNAHTVFPPLKKKNIKLGHRNAYIKETWSEVSNSYGSYATIDYVDFLPI